MTEVLRACTVLMFGLISQNALSCSCVGESTVEEGFKSADIVASGQVIRSIIEWVPDSVEIKEMIELGFSTDSLDKRLFGQYFRKVQLLVDNVYKGKTGTDTLTIYTGVGGGDCGFRFDVGQQYILYGDSDSYFSRFIPNRKTTERNSVYWTNICMRTQKYNRSEAKALEKLRR